MENLQRDARRRQVDTALLSQTCGSRIVDDDRARPNEQIDRQVHFAFGRRNERRFERLVATSATVTSFAGQTLLARLLATTPLSCTAARLDGCVMGSRVAASARSRPTAVTGGFARRRTQWRCANQIAGRAQGETQHR